MLTLKLTFFPSDSPAASPAFDSPADLEPVEAVLARWQSAAATAFEQERPASPSPAFNVELPPTKSAPRRRIIWAPSAPGRASAGKLTIITGRSISHYLVREFTADGGLCFHLAKLSEGSDPSERSHDVYLADPATADAGFAFDSCSCKGFQRYLHCKHVDACHAIIGERIVKAIEAAGVANAAAKSWKHNTAKDLAADASYRM